MTPQKKLNEIKSTWSAFKHWSDKDPDSRYVDSAGPDVAWLIARVEQLEHTLSKIQKAIHDKTGDCDQGGCCMECLEAKEAIHTGPKPE